MLKQRSYEDFDLAIEAVGDGRFRARVLDSPSGQASIEFEVPFSDMELENFLLKIGRPRSGTRRLESPETEAARAFGSRLYEAVFATDVGRQWARSIDAAERENRGLRLRLRLSEAPELCDLPWEYLYSPTSDDFVVLSSWTPVVRYISLDKGAPPLRVAPPLKMLAMVSSPNDYPPLDVEAEWGRLDEAMGGVVAAGLVEIHRLENATLRELQRAMRRTDFHLFHFIGHGGFDEQADDGVLLLETEEGRAREVSGRQLGTILDDARTVRVAVLNACEGARASGTDPFAGVAQSLVARGIPAVVAMQFEISDRAAIVFAHEFYTAITDGLAVEGAVGEARRAIFGSKSDVEWGTAVLYMRAEDGRLFDIDLLAEATREIEATTMVLEAEAVPTTEHVAIGDPPQDEPPDNEVMAERAAAPSRVVDPVHDDAGRDDAGHVDPGHADPAPPSDAAPQQVDPAPPSDAAPWQVDPAPPSDAAPQQVDEKPDEVPAVDSVEAPYDAGRDHRRWNDTRPSDPPPISMTPVPSEPPPAGWAARHSGLFSAIIVALLAVLVIGFVIINGRGVDPETTTTSPDVTDAPGELEIVESVDVVASPAAGITVDADFSDWETEGATAFRLDSPVSDDLAATRLGDDSVGIMQLASDATSLYVKVEVADDTYSQPNDGNQIWRGDAFDINLSVGSDGATPERPDEETYQLTLTPLSEVSGGPAAVLFVGNGQAFSSNTTDIPVEVEGRVVAGGWILEAAIPWQVFGLSGPPGQLDAALFAVFDNDGEFDGDRSLQAEILAHKSSVFFQQPLTWGTLSTP